MTAPELGRIVWHTSSYSAGSGNCVEVAPAPDGVLVRDSKDRHGSTLAVSGSGWHALLHTVTR
jgi:uncharacterized protein DUF397